MTTPKTVFIITKYLMFQDGLKSLLNQQGEIEIAGWATNPDQAVDQIETLHPDAVIFDSTGLPGRQTTLLERRILHASPGIKMIKVNLHSNRLSIYQRMKQRTVASYQVLVWKVEDVNDLIRAIGGSGFPPSQPAPFL